MSQPSNTPSPIGQGGSGQDEAAHDLQVDRATGSVQDSRPQPDEPGRGPDPLDGLRAELAMIDQQPVVDRVPRFEHANVVLAAALAELDEV